MANEPEFPKDPKILDAEFNLALLVERTRGLLLQVGMAQEHLSKTFEGFAAALEEMSVNVPEGSLAVDLATMAGLAGEIAAAAARAARELKGPAEPTEEEKKGAN